MNMGTELSLPKGRTVCKSFEMDSNEEVWNGFQSDYEEDEELPFANEDRNKFKEDFFVAANFAHDLFRDVLPKYGLENLLDAPMFEQDIEREKSPYCGHIGEAVIILSFANRLKFKLLFDEQCEHMMESDFYYERFAYDFCKGFYTDGHVEQFLIICGFFIDLAIYLYCKTGKNMSNSLPALFGDIFRFSMRKMFFQKGGGWTEVKLKAKPWWHSYRNIKYKQEIYTQNNICPPRPVVDFHNPRLELCNDNFANILLSTNYPKEIKTLREYPYVCLEDVVPKSNARLSPICELGVAEGETLKETLKEKPKRKRRDGRKKNNCKRETQMQGRKNK